MPNGKVRRQGLAPRAGPGRRAAAVQGGLAPGRARLGKGQACSARGSTVTRGWRDGGLEPGRFTLPCRNRWGNPASRSSKGWHVSTAPRPMRPPRWAALGRSPARPALGGRRPGCKWYLLCPFPVSLLIPEGSQNPPGCLLPCHTSPGAGLLGHVGRWGGKDLLGQAEVKPPPRATRWAWVCPAWHLWPKPPWPFSCGLASAVRTAPHSAPRCDARALHGDTVTSLSAGCCRTEPHSALKGDPAAVLFNPFPTLPRACSSWSLTPPAMHEMG